MIRSRVFIGEFLGTAFLLMVVVGSGIMGESLAQGNAAIAHLAALAPTFNRLLSWGASNHAYYRVFTSAKRIGQTPDSGFYDLVL